MRTEIFALLIIVIILAVLFAAWLFMIAPRVNHPGWEFLGKFRYAHRGLHSPESERRDRGNTGTGMPEKEHTGAGTKPGTAYLPENSLPAFALAAEKGFGAELDVHFTKDLQLAVVHDSNLKRVTGEDVRVEDLTAEEMRRLHLMGTSEKIPFLEEVLPLFAKSGTPLVVEIKTAGRNYNALTDATVACLERFPVKWCMESFDPHVILHLKKSRPDIIRGQLSMNHMHNKSLGVINRFFLTNLLYDFLTRPDFIAYDFGSRRNLSCRLSCGLLRGHEVNWTIRSREDMQQAEKEGHLVIFENFVP
jgi:glycerophosphoryl diester phosphodiesterase